MEQLYLQFEHPLRKYALSLCRRTEEAEDLLQETFLRAMAHSYMLERLPSFKQQAWLFKTIKNLFIDRRRRQRFEISQEPLQLAETAQSYSGSGDSSFSPYSWLEICELLDHLPARDRDIVIKRHLLGMNSKQIGAALSMPDATVRYRLHMAMEKLKRKLLNTED